MSHYDMTQAGYDPTQTGYHDPTRQPLRDATYKGDLQSLYAPDHAPRIEDRFARSVVPVQLTPSDRVAFATYALVFQGGGLDVPFRLVNRQPEGVACKLRVQNVSATAAQDVALLTGSSDYGVITAVGALSFVQNGYVLRSGPSNAPPPPFEIVTKDEIWIAPLQGVSIVVSVCVETFDLW